MHPPTVRPHRSPAHPGPGITTRSRRFRWRSLACIAALLLATIAAAPMAADAQDADDGSSDGPRVTAADGTTRAIDAVDPGSRVADILALYTSDFGASTGTNAFGAEAVLEPADDGPGRFEIVDVCSVFDGCPNPGDNPIPDDGYVLSASPTSSADVDDPRLFIRDHLAVGDVVTLELPVLRSATTTLDATDPTADDNPDGVDASTGECFPGCRGAGQMILYTPAFGETTGTNQFGYEVVVVDDRVVARGGADNAIPDDGYVLSGHGPRGEWLATNAPIGGLVSIDGDQLTISVDIGAYLFGAEQAIERAAEDLGTALDACLDVDASGAEAALAEARALRAEAQDAADDGDELAAVELAQAAQAAGEQAWYATRTSRELETRGVWVRPEQETPGAIAEEVARLASAGFTTLYLETFFQGYTIFPSSTADAAGVEAQRPQFAHFDPLEIWIDEARAHGLEVHAWVHSFFVGNDALGGPGPILEVHPEWAAVEFGDVGSDGPQPSTAEAGYYFVDPSIAEARAYLHGVFDEIVTDYDVDGLHLDYIRYPISLPQEVSFSYSDHARTAFEAEFGVDPYELTPDDDRWEDWNEWRRDQVRSFVAESHERLQDGDRDVVLSAAVFPDRFDAEERKLQDWSSWSQAGTIDLLTGMSFGGSPERNAEDTQIMLEATSDDTLVVTGTYAPFNSLPADTMLEQIDAVRAAGAHGVALFAANQLSDSQVDALAAGSFREPATSVDVDPVVSTSEGIAALRARVGDVHADCLDRGVERPLNQRLGQVERQLARADGPGGSGDAALRTAQGTLAELRGWLDGRVDATPLADQLHEELRRAEEVVTFAR